MSNRKGLFSFQLPEEVKKKTAVDSSFGREHARQLLRLEDPEKKKRVDKIKQEEHNTQPIWVEIPEEVRQKTLNVESFGIGHAEELLRLKEEPLKQLELVDIFFLNCFRNRNPEVIRITSFGITYIFPIADSFVCNPEKRRRPGWGKALPRSTLLSFPRRKR